MNANDTHDKRNLRFFYLALTSALLISQLGSYLVERFIAVGKSVEVMSFVYLTHVRNTGGIFGLFQGNGRIISAIAAVFLSLLIVYIHRSKRLPLYEHICVGLIVGGGLANIADRLIYGSVIDFMDVRGISFWNYIFNTADVMIHLGIWPLLIFSLFAKEKQHEAAVEQNEEQVSQAK